MTGSLEFRQSNRRSDGEETHAAILDKAVRLASIEGVNQITLGRLAEKTGVSKSGVYAHFGSKERLQLEIIQAADEIFQREVVDDARNAPEGLARLANLFEAYLSYLEREVFPGGCFFDGLVSEYDAQSGPIHEAVLAGRSAWDDFVERAAVAAQRRGEIDQSVDPRDFAFELDAVINHTNMLYTLYRDPQIIERGRSILSRVFQRYAMPQSS